MKSIKELYRIGTGPSSSHTMGPRKAAEMFVERHPDAASFKVTLYGSLAATGKGHMTDVAIIDTLKTTAPVEIIWQPKVWALATRGRPSFLLFSFTRARSFAIK